MTGGCAPPKLCGTAHTENMANTKTKKIIIVLAVVLALAVVAGVVVFLVTRNNKVNYFY